MVHGEANERKWDDSLLRRETVRATDQDTPYVLLHPQDASRAGRRRA